MSQSFPNQREFFRLTYLDELSPTIVINRRDYTVPEISERGLRIQCARFREFQINGKISGMLYLINGDVVSVTGIAVRRDAKHYILNQLDGLTMRRIMSEQRAVIEHSKIIRETNQSNFASRPKWAL